MPPRASTSTPRLTLLWSAVISTVRACCSESDATLACKLATCAMKRWRDQYCRYSTVVGSVQRPTSPACRLQFNAPAMETLIRSSDNKVTWNLHAIQLIQLVKYENACTFTFSGYNNPLRQHLYHCEECEKDVCLVCATHCHHHDDVVDPKPLSRLGFQEQPVWCACPRHSCLCVPPEEARLYQFLPHPVDTSKITLGIKVPLPKQRPCLRSCCWPDVLTRCCATIGPRNIVHPPRAFEPRRLASVWQSHAALKLEAFSPRCHRSCCCKNATKCGLVCEKRPEQQERGDKPHGDVGRKEQPEGSHQGYFWRKGAHGSCLACVCV